MTQKRKTHCPKCNHDLEPISNYFDRLLDGVGHRGSSFTDVDALTHDDPTDRYLFQEFKGPGEELNKGQKKYLKGLSRREYTTVWCVRKRADGYIDWFDVATSIVIEVITEGEYRERFKRWWDRVPVVVPVTPSLKPKLARDAVPIVTADEVFGGSNRKKDQGAA